MDPWIPFFKDNRLTFLQSSSRHMSLPTRQLGRKPIRTKRWSRCVSTMAAFPPPLLPFLLPSHSPFRANRETLKNRESINITVESTRFFLLPSCTICYSVCKLEFTYFLSFFFFFFFPHFFEHGNEHAINRVKRNASNCSRAHKGRFVNEIA